MADQARHRNAKSSPQKYFYSYISAMAELQISRRTLQRWIDDMEVEPLEFEDQLRVFLTLPHMQRLRDYKRVMYTKDRILISRYRMAIQTGNLTLIARIRKGLRHVSE